jgi:hypothetical protein
MKKPDNDIKFWRATFWAAVAGACVWLALVLLVA